MFWGIKQAKCIISYLIWKFKATLPLFGLTKWTLVIPFTSRWTRTIIIQGLWTAKSTTVPKWSIKTTDHHTFDLNQPLWYLKNRLYSNVIEVYTEIVMHTCRWTAKTQNLMDVLVKNRGGNIYDGQFDIKPYLIG